MALWKDQTAPRKDAAPELDSPPLAATPGDAAFAPPAAAPRRPSTGDAPESVIGADLAVEGTISGRGNVRLAGRFTGDVTVDGIVTIEPGARLAGGVRATTVAIAGELEGNVVQAERVDVLASGALVGDLKAETLTLAAGSRVRGHIECGWVDAPARGRAAGGRLATPSSTSAVPAGADLAAKNGAEPDRGS